MAMIRLKKRLYVFLILSLIASSRSLSLAIETRPSSSTPTGSCDYAADNKEAPLRDLTQIISAFLKAIDQLTRSQIGSAPGTQQDLNEAFLHAVQNSNWSPYIQITITTAEALAPKQIPVPSDSPSAVSIPRNQELFSGFDSFVFHTQSFGKLSPYLSNYIRGILLKTLRSTDQSQTRELLTNLIHGMFSILRELSLRNRDLTEEERHQGTMNLSYFLWQAFQSEAKSSQAAHRFFSNDDHTAGIRAAADLFLEIKTEFAETRATTVSSTPATEDPLCDKIIAIFSDISSGTISRTTQASEPPSVLPSTPRVAPQTPPASPRVDARRTTPAPAAAPTPQASPRESQPPRTASTEGTPVAPGASILSFRGPLSDTSGRIPNDVQRRIDWLRQQFAQNLGWRIALREVLTELYSNHRFLKIFINDLAGEGFISLSHINLDNQPRLIFMELIKENKNRSTFWATILRRALTETDYRQNHPELKALSGDAPLTQNLMTLMSPDRIYVGMHPHPQSVPPEIQTALAQLRAADSIHRPLLTMVRETLFNHGFNNVSEIQVLAHDIGLTGIRSEAIRDMLFQLLDEAKKHFNHNDEITALAVLRAAHFLRPEDSTFQPFAPRAGHSTPPSVSTPETARPTPPAPLATPSATTRHLPLNLDFSLDLRGNTSGDSRVNDMTHWAPELRTLALYLSRNRPNEALATRLAVLFNSAANRVTLLNQAGVIDGALLGIVRQSNSLDAWNELFEAIYKEGFFAGKTIMMNLLVCALRSSEQDLELVRIYQEITQAASAAARATAPSTAAPPPRTSATPEQTPRPEAVEPPRSTTTTTPPRAAALSPRSDLPLINFDDIEMVLGSVFRTSHEVIMAAYDAGIPLAHLMDPKSNSHLSISPAIPVNSIVTKILISLQPNQTRTPQIAQTDLIRRFMLAALARSTSSHRSSHERGEYEDDGIRELQTLLNQGLAQAPRSDLAPEQRWNPWVTLIRPFLVRIYNNPQKVHELLRISNLLIPKVNDQNRVIGHTIPGHLAMLNTPSTRGELSQEYRWHEALVTLQSRHPHGQPYESPELLRLFMTFMRDNPHLLTGSFGHNFIRLALMIPNISLSLADGELPYQVEQARRLRPYLLGFYHESSQIRALFESIGLTLEGPQNDLDPHALIDEFLIKAVQSSIPQGTPNLVIRVLQAIERDGVFNPRNSSVLSRVSPGNSRADADYFFRLIDSSQ